VIRQFFEKGFYKLTPQVRCDGRLAWAPILFLPTRDDACILRQDAGGQWALGQMDKNSFTPLSHPPLMTPFRLDVNTEAMAVRAKKRPVVLLASERLPELWRLKSGTSHTRLRLQPHVGWLVVPIYDYDADADLQQLVEALYFPQFFPMLGNNACPQYDSFARLDRLQTVHASLIELTDYCMGDDIMATLREAVVSYATGTEQGESYATLRSTFVEELRRQNVVY
jgi:hypothetical protein